MVSRDPLRSKAAAALAPATPTFRATRRRCYAGVTIIAIASGMLFGLPAVSNAAKSVHNDLHDAPMRWRVQDDNIANDTRGAVTGHRFDAMHALLPNTRSFVVKKGIRAYRVWLYTPESNPSQRASMPLLVLLDGNAMFPIALQAARLQQRLIGPLVIAAIAPDDENLFDEAARYRDFTTATAANAWGVPTFAALHAHETAIPPQHIASAADAARVPTGGADNFRALVREVVLPEIRRRAAIDPARTTLFGHSLGGLFVLNTAIEDRCLFSRYIAASPSLWWNERQLLRNTHVRVDAQCGPRPVTLQVGGAEQTLPPDAPPARVERVTHAAMLDNVMAMSTLLRQAPDDYALDGPHVYPNGNHVSYLPAALSDAVRDATTANTSSPHTASMRQ
jgi:predicted alpha/beta superfamily hydrolase